MTTHVDSGQRRRHADLFPPEPPDPPQIILKESNGVGKWLRVEVIAFFIQTIVLVGGLVWGYSKLEAKVDEIGRRLNDHIDTHSRFLLKETWSERNKFIDAKLDSIERKVDILIMDNKKR